MLELFDKTDTYLIEGVRFKSYHLYKTVLKAMKENTETITTGKDYLMTLVFLERITGYAVNLCEWIVYLKSGNIVEL